MEGPVAKARHHSGRKPEWYTVQRREGRAAAVVFCSYCNFEEVITQQGRIASEWLERRLKGKGWGLPRMRGKTTCPKCAVKFRSINKKGKEKMAREDLKVVASNEKGNRPPADFKIQRQVAGLLETYYDEEAKCYRQGYTDAKIGEEVGVSEQFVCRFRSEAFGPLAVPNEISQLKGDIDDMQQMLNDLRSRLEHTLRKFD